MGINKAENQLNNRLFKEIEELKRQIKDFKTPQPIGSDVLKVIAVPEGGALSSGLVTITAGLGLTTTFTITPQSQILTNWDFLLTPYIDGSTSADIFPNGANLDANKRKAIFQWWVDWALSSDATNVRVVKARLYNNDSSSHDYMIKMRAYVPAITASGA